MTIVRETLTSRVCAELRGEILSGSLRPGERLSESEIAHRFGISPTPVREAMRLLVNDGLVNYTDRKGVRVIMLTESEIRKAFSARNAIERQALKEAFPLMKRADREKLLEMAQRTAEARGKAAGVLLEIDRHFHAHFVEHSRNTWLREFSSRLGNVLTVARLDLFNAPDLAAAVAEHVAIATAVLEDDYPRADRELDAHIQRVCENAIAAHKRLESESEPAGKGDS